MRRMTMTAGAVLTLMFPLLTGAAAPPDPLTIEVLVQNGTGCTPATNPAVVTVQPDNQSFEIRYAAYRAQVGVGTVPIDMRKNCQLGLIFHRPAGYTLAFDRVNYRLSASVAAGASAQLRTNYYSCGCGPSYPLHLHSQAGPHDGAWEVTETWEDGSTRFLPCAGDTMLTISTELRVVAGTSNVKTTTSFVTLDHADDLSLSTFHLKWLACP